jgi:hypothetical protein
MVQRNDGGRSRGVGLTVVVKVAGNVSLVVESAASLGLQLRPLHPGSDDPELTSWFVAETDDGKVVSALRRMAGVDAAYVKPDDELP